MKQQVGEIVESEIEDALVAHLDILRGILATEKEVRLISRQLRLVEGKKRLDILLTVGNDIFLVEIKREPFKEKFIGQIRTYYDELRALQKDKKLISGEIIPVILVTDFNDADVDRCTKAAIRIHRYSPLDVLKQYFERMASIATFMKIRPVDLGVFNIGLINRIMNGLGEGASTLEELSDFSDLTAMSADHHLKFASELGLVVKRKNRYFLTDLGITYISLSDDTIPSDELSERQTTILREKVAADPFFSPVVFGIYTIVESALFLSRNSYPIDLKDLQSFFLEASGKRYEWKAKKSLSTATYSYLNYSIKLGLLGKIGKSIVITPTGFRFILMLQLHKSIEMVESLTVEH